MEAKVETAVNDLLETYFKKAYPRATVLATKAHQTDGLIEVSSPSDSFSILVEAKRGYQLGGTGPRDRAKILAQAIGYLKQFEKRGQTLPSAVVLADEDEIFTLPRRVLAHYLSGPYDWSLAPSSQWEDSKLFLALTEDPNLNSIYVEHTFRETFDPEHFCARVESYALDRSALEKLRVDKHSLEKAFAEFQRIVFGGITPDEKTKKVELFGKKKSVTYAQVQIFIKALLGDKNIYLDPVDRKTVIIVYKDVKGKEQMFRYPPATGFTFNPEAYEQFFTKFDRGRAVYDLAARREITEIADTLFDEFDRRFTGDYWTPQIWVDEAHKMIEEQLGADWKEKFVVWDPACGAKNLTRGYKFKELYCSTLHQEELNIAEDYNPEATTFQYDFLNDDMGIHDFAKALDFGSTDEMSVDQFKLPDSLIEALKANKPIVFFANPPYGQNGSTVGKDAKKGISSTATTKLMEVAGLTYARHELYAQFIYRVQLLAKRFKYTKEFHFFFFFNKGFLTSPSFSGFTDKLCSEFQFKKGFMLNAGEFKGTSAAWGIIFAHWQLLNSSSAPNEFVFDVKQSDNEGIIQDITKWRGRQVPKGKDLSVWSRQKVNFKKAEQFPLTSNGFEKSKGSTVTVGSYPTDAFGYVGNISKNLGDAARSLVFFSMASSRGHGSHVNKDHFTPPVITFSSQRSCSDLYGSKLPWVRDKDVFPAPSEALQSDSIFTADCVTYSLFASGSNQTSLRGYEYGGKKWDVLNEFFWLPRDWVRTWAEQEKLWDLRDDADLFPEERYVATWLKDNWDGVSPEGKALLKTANSILKASLRHRSAYAVDQPKYNILTWDAGWLQIYKMCFSRDALPAAKSDVKLQALYEAFKVQRRTLGDSIAKRYSDDTGF